MRLALALALLLFAADAHAQTPALSADRRLQREAGEHPMDPGLMAVGAALALGFLGIVGVEMVSFVRYRRQHPDEKRPPRRRR